MPRMRAVSMRNVWIIAHREYTERVRTRGFLITTIMIPVIMGMFAVGTVFFGSRSVSDLRIAVVSPDTQLALDLQDELVRMRQHPPDAADPNAAGVKPIAPRETPHLLVDAIDPGPNTRAEMDHSLDSGDIDGYLWITPATSLGGRPTFAFTPRFSRDAPIKNTLTVALDKVLIREQLTHRGIVAADADTMLQPVQIVASHKPRDHDDASAQISVSVLFFVMYLVIMLYGMNVARSIIEEKTSRIFEVLLATIRPEAMMAGKIIGVGSVGLTQVGIWLAAALALAGASTALHFGGDSLHISLTVAQVLFFFIYFILGYLFYAAIAAGLGAMTNSEQELQQLNMFLVMPLLFCFVMLGTLLTTPDSTLSRVLALLPPFTPLLMYFRVSLGHPYAWEVALSLVLTSASICGI
ncbi:MAG: ABC transporter permease, partial [Acidobacteriota bacterium]|nr:ABC transporter permease [Acidobacteriota bacterium]